ncbi:MAG: efflux RND transporter periplasmic adaptor subunit, partial [Planctomycetota bacterium]
MNNKSLTRRIVKGIVALLLVASLGTITYIRATEEPMGTTSIEEIEHRDGKAVAATDVQRRDFASYIRADGTVRAPERYVLRSNISEKVQRVPVDVGDAVEPGEILVQLRKDDIKSEIEAASTRFKEARKNYERYTNLLERGVVSADTVEARRTAMKEARSDLTRANSRMKFTTIRAPEKSNLNYNGDNVMVTHRHVDPGEFKGSGEPLVTLADMSRMEIKATVPQQAMKYLSRGEEMNFRLEGEDEWQRAPIRRISPGTEDPHRFFRVYAATDNDGNRGEWRIRPGMYAEVRL